MDLSWIVEKLINVSENVQKLAGAGELLNKRVDDAEDEIATLDRKIDAEVQKIRDDLDAEKQDEAQAEMQHQQKRSVWVERAWHLLSAIIGAVITAIVAAWKALQNHPPAHHP